MRRTPALQKYVGCLSGPYETPPPPCVDPELEQSSNAGHRETSQSSYDIPHGAPPGDVGDQAASNRKRGADRRDDVADPVNQVQERAFRLRAGLALDRDVNLRGCARDSGPAAPNCVVRNRRTAAIANDASASFPIAVA